MQQTPKLNTSKTQLDCLALLRSRKVGPDDPRGPSHHGIV